MPLKRLAVCTAAFLLSLGLATSPQASAKTFSLTGGGGQIHIGNGLALPIQAAIPNFPATPTKQPPLLIPVKAGQFVTGTTAMAKVTVGTKSGYQRKLVVPAGALSKPAAYKVVGVKFSNPSLYAVATNIKYTWPAAPAVFSTGGPFPTPTIGDGNGTMVYSNALGSRFGGPAQFTLSPGVASGLYAGAPITLFLVIGAATPPCAHPAFGGSTANPNDVGCVAGMMLVKPTGVGGVGGATPTLVKTPGFPIAGKNIAIVKMGAVPLGTILAAALAATNTAIPTNMATSQAGPWTTGKIVISNPKAGGSGELFTISGKDSRTVGGGGSIQLVSGALSKRAASGPNGNRGWLRLDLAPLDAVPSMSMPGLAALVALMLLGFGYATRRRMLS